MDPSSGQEETLAFPDVSAVQSQTLRPTQSVTYLQALLGDTALPPGQLDQVIPALSEASSSPRSVTTSTVFVSGGSMSASLSNPTFTTAKRNRSVSFSVASSLSFASPLRSREHASEAGSPTLEQALLMSHQTVSGGDAGYGSLSMPNSTSQSDLYSSTSFLQSLQDSSPEHSTPSQTRPTLSEMVGIDLAVAQAVQNLQKLQQQQAQLYSGLGVASVPNQVSTPIIPDSSQSAQRQDQAGISILNSILSSVTQSTPQPSYKDSSDHHVPDPTPYTQYQSSNPGHGPTDPLALERAARLYRSAASVCEASCTWSGQLPPRSSTAGPNSSYSTKIFLGGVPWDISEQTLVQAFAEFGEVRVEWPGRDYTSPPRGYLYLVFQEEGDVTDLLAKCCQDYNTRDSYYYKISSRRMRAKEVQIIPWVLTDSNYVRCPSPRLDPQKTVFVGALHGMMTAQGLAVVFNDLFGGVVYSGLDTDKFKYPIGSGRVTFNNSRSYMKAVAAAFIEIKTPRFCKKVQVDPYLEDTLCSMCGMKQGPYFCRDLGCFNYFCHSCWDLHHTSRPHHKPLMRNIRGLTRARTSHHHDYNVGRYRQDPVRDLAEQFGQTFGLHG